jgi:hypothetical protein
MLPAAGYRSSGGSAGNRGASCFYWSSTKNSSYDNAMYLRVEYLKSVSVFTTRKYRFGYYHDSKHKYCFVAYVN